MTVYSINDVRPNPNLPKVGFMDEEIYSVTHQRSNDMHYHFTDGTNTGLIKHYVPYNWIEKNLIDKHMIKKTRSVAMRNLYWILDGLGIPSPITSTHPNRPDYDTWIDNAIDAIANWEPNLFKDTSYGDANGKLIDVPDSDDVLARVKKAASELERYELTSRPIDMYRD